jgi:hypothetical protein
MRIISYRFVTLARHMRHYPAGVEEQYGYPLALCQTQNLAAKQWYSKTG